MEDLNHLWKNLPLTDAEDAIVVEEEELQVEDSPKHPHLLRQLLSIRPFNRQSLINTMRGLWKPAKDLIVDTMDVNYLFVFRFQGRGDIFRFGFSTNKYFC